ncbi:MAG: TRASH domain-containing protein [Thermoplasmata archaeon]
MNCESCGMEIKGEPVTKVVMEVEHHFCCEHCAASFKPEEMPHEHH